MKREFRVCGCDAKTEEKTVVEFRLRVDGDGDIMVEARNPKGMWQGVCYFKLSAGTLNAMSVGVPVSGLLLDKKHDRINFVE